MHVENHCSITCLSFAQHSHIFIYNVLFFSSKLVCDNSFIMTASQSMSRDVTSYVSAEYQYIWCSKSSLVYSDKVLYIDV